jgi:hypothetical protein
MSSSSMSRRSLCELFVGRAIVDPYAHEMKPSSDAPGKPFDYPFTCERHEFSNRAVRQVAAKKKRGRIDRPHKAHTEI